MSSSAGTNQRSSRKKASAAKPSPASNGKVRRTPTRRSAVPPTSVNGSKHGDVSRGNNGMFDETIPSDFGASRDLQSRLLGLVTHHRFTPHSIFAIKLALEEAMINAIKHGNKLDPKKHVHVKAKVTEKIAEFTIEDEGPGFDRTCVPDPTLIENLEKCSGRGLMLIEAYMNEVEWTRKGRRLRMVKRNGEEAGR